MSPFAGAGLRNRHHSNQSINEIIAPHGSAIINATIAAPTGVNRGDSAETPKTGLVLRFMGIVYLCLVTLLLTGIHDFK